ncbi:MAG: hypothetical protein ABFS56_29690 [Pseudomonadota bacterium]
MQYGNTEILLTLKAVMEIRVLLVAVGKVYALGVINFSEINV